MLENKENDASDEVVRGRYGLASCFGITFRNLLSMMNTCASSIVGVKIIIIIVNLTCGM